MKNENLSFDNTEIAFAYKDNFELLKAKLLFGVMSKSGLSNALSNSSVRLVKAKVPFVNGLIKETIFKQFLGGETLMECTKPIEKLNSYKVLTVLDYAAEAKTKELELEEAKEEFLRALEYAVSQESVPVVSIKISALASNELLEKWQNHDLLTTEEIKQFNRIKNRVNQICKKGEELGIKIFIDAEESWIQDTIDALVVDMMVTYNKENVIVYNTYQMYRTDRLDVLKKQFELLRSKGSMLGAKLVRGAYMEKERSRAAANNQVSPIWENKSLCDRAFNDAITFCLPRFDEIALCAATHNEESCRMMAKQIKELDVRDDHPHLNFCQLYGMGDLLSFNLAKAGYNVAKYLPYGAVSDALPYLVRRAQENSAVSGEMSREYKSIQKELRRRKRKA